MDKTYISKSIAKHLSLSQDLIYSLLTKPKERNRGDYTLPVFQLAKKENPVSFAKTLSESLASVPLFSKVQAVGPYINIFILEKVFAEYVVSSVMAQKEKYGSLVQEKPQTYVLDYSAPNIAKPFGIGHLRSTVIGNALKNILLFSGHSAIGINYIGDWGTQFGKVICAFKKWGSEEKLQKDPIGHLLELYVTFHEQAETDDRLNDEARIIFAELEKGNEEYLSLWKSFRELSLTKFQETYDLLDVSFDLVRGEAYYNDKMASVVSLLEKKNLLKESEGARIIDFADFGVSLPPLIIIKSNGASTYALRDLAAAIDRVESFSADHLIYEVGAEQKLHFEQIIATLRLLEFSFAENIVHVYHGFYRFGNEKFSTRKGNLILMEDVIGKAIEKVKGIIQEKNPLLAESKQFNSIATDVGVAALLFFDMKNDRVKDVSFNWDSILDFQGESGPYIQYTSVRIQSILSKQSLDKAAIDFTLLSTEEDRILLNHLLVFSDAVSQSFSQYKPHVVARYVFDLAQLFNDYYQKHKILTEDTSLTHSRLALLVAIAQVLENGCSLLGIRLPKEM